MKNMEWKPYEEERIDEKTVIRTFREGLAQEDLKWHQDAVDRLTTALEPTKWKFQLDNQLPVSFDKPIMIPNHVWHRVIPGPGRLKVEVKDLG